MVSPPWGTFHFVPGMDWDRPDLPPDHLARSMMALQRAATASATVRTRPAAELPTKSPRRCARWQRVLRRLSSGRVTMRERLLSARAMIPDRGPFAPTRRAAAPTSTR